MKRTFLFVGLLLLCQSVLAQNDTVMLDEAIITDAYLLRFTETQSRIQLTDSVTERNAPLLTSLLKYNTPVYFKENGLGMVSSPSFRGTTASQTAVVWNGININSRFNGQTDFNTITTDGFSNIVLKPGGASMGYGSGAIGGSIHLNNELTFQRGTSGGLNLSYGSFNTYSIGMHSKYSDETFSLNLSLGRTASDNDYKFPRSNLKNENGEYFHQNFSLSAAYKLDSKNTLKFFGRLSDGERHFSLITPGAAKTKYQDFSARSLADWTLKSGNVNSSLKLAYLTEEFTYYPTLANNNFSYGDAETFILNYDFGYQVSPKIFLNGIAELNHDKGKGSDVVSAKRTTEALSLLMKHKLAANLLYEAGIRKEFSDVYDTPFLYSFGMKWKPYSIYEVSFNTSKNFRMPTFNDLFWPGSGNLNLKPESSYQAEIGNEIRLNDFSIRLTAYYNSISDMLRWVPQSGDFWAPVNTDKVEIYGLESLLDYHKKLGRHQLGLNATYAYTISKDKKTGKQLIYAPYHKATASLVYSLENFSAFFRSLYNGKVYTDSQNRNELKAYWISDLGVEYSFGEKRNLRLGFQVLNLWDREYESVLNRIMPGRNYNVNINFKF